jgi:tripartite-type tricarboxylate transporter receptor subunit TctC
MRLRTVAISLAGLVAASVPALADAVSDFYSGPGKQVRMIIRSGVGGGYDQYSRLMARHIGKHIPGNPQILPVNMPGGGGIVAANYVAKVAPRDGTILTMVSQGLTVDQALGLNPSFQADLREFHWIGNMSNSSQTLAVWHTSQTKTLEDAKRRETLIGSTGAGSISTQLPVIFNNMLGTKFKIIAGYADGKDVDLAMERGEVEGRGANPWVSYQSQSPRFISDKLIIPLVQVGLVRDLPNVPMLNELARRPEDQPVLDFMSKAAAVGRPIATTPGVPADRVAALRRAFDATIKDPEFIKEAETSRSEINAMPGEELARIINELIGAPAPVLAAVKKALESKDVTEDLPKKK